jgi:hypothetical protein
MLTCDWSSIKTAAVRGWTPSAKQFSVLKQLQFRCSGCGLRSRGSKSVPSGLMSLVTGKQSAEAYCVFCFQTQALNLPVNGHREHGLIFYQPDVSQKHINQLALRALWAQSKGNKYSVWASAVVKEIERLKLKAADLLMIEPEMLTIRHFLEIKYSLPDDLKTREGELFGGIRYWPLREPYNQIVAYYDKAVLSNEEKEVA